MKLFTRCAGSLCLALFCTAAAYAADKKYTIAVIPKGTTHEYWKSIHAGALQAKEELAQKGITVDLIWKGPLREDDRDQQIQVVENFMTRRVNGIVLAPLDSQALAAPVANATRARIPVVIMDSDLKSDKHVSFVATDNYKGGAMAAEQLAKLLGGKGKVIVLRYAVGSASTEAREKGFIDTMKKQYPEINLLSTEQYAGATRESAFQAAQNLLNRYGKEVQGVFCPCEPVTVGMLMALKNIGKTGGKVKVVGFDAGIQPLDALKKGDVQALVLQNPMRMGYLGVETLVKHLEGEKVDPRIDTGVYLVTSENMKDPEADQLLNPPLQKYLK